jgi:hypothetical protein
VKASVCLTRIRFALILRAGGERHRAHVLDGTTWMKLYPGTEDQINMSQAPSIDSGAERRAAAAVPVMVETAQPAQAPS